MQGETGTTARWSKFRSMLGIGAVGCLVLALAACGGGASNADTGSGGDTAKGEMTTIKVGILPITSVAALKLGIDKGFFKEENLTIETEVAQSGAALVPAIVSGQYQFGFSNNLSLILARGKGLPVKIVRTANSADSDPTPSQEALVVSKKSGISSVKDLAGKTIAVNSLNNTPHISVLVTLEKAGVDTSTVKFVEVGFPDMPLAIQEGRVDAADISEPFLTKALQEGGVDLAHPYRVLEQDQHLSSWFTTETYIAKNKDVVERFARAVDKSNSYARDHSDEIRAFVPTYLKIDAQLAKDMALPRFPEGTPKQSSLENLAAAAQRFGFIKEAPKGLDEIIATNVG
jgi:NitT/TauT family transport system substrate-binding protein